MEYEDLTVNHECAPSNPIPELFHKPKIPSIEGNAMLEKVPYDTNTDN